MDLLTEFARIAETPVQDDESWREGCSPVSVWIVGVPGTSQQFVEMIVGEEVWRSDSPEAIGGLAMALLENAGKLARKIHHG